MNADSEFRKLLALGKQAKGTSEADAVAAMISAGALTLDAFGFDLASYELFANYGTG